MTNIGIVGYGNLGKACEVIAHEDDRFNLVGIFTRRNIESMVSPYSTAFFSQEDLWKFVGDIDVLVLCTGSANDLVPLALNVCRQFNTVDCFDNHEKMREYIVALDNATKVSGHLSVVGVGWDPGLFSLVRGLFEGCIMGKAHTFWGEGVSQGHSEAVRKLKGVKMAVQYTIPKEDAIESVKKGAGDNLTKYDKHKRVCYVVAEENADKSQIENEIKNMPDYFLGYETEVYFVDESEFLKNHNHLSHGGRVLCSKNISGCLSKAEFELKLDSNPYFTARVLMSYAICTHNLFKKGERGAKTIFDIPITALFEGNRLDIIEKYL